MRIRSTKPEFFRSKRVSEDIPDWGNRYLLKALESYVDDNGVGKDNVALIAADCFPHDVALDPSGTFRRLPEGLSALFEAGFIHRYEANGERLLYISWWESTQYVPKPKPGRHPRPDGTFGYKESVIGQPDRKPPETSGSLRPVSGGQGVRGSGGQGYMVTVENDADRSPDDDAGALIEPEQAGPSHEDLFHRFWEHWPRKVKKPEALTAFIKAAKREDPHRIIAGAERYAQDPNLPDAQFVPHPATWLNNDQWNDGPLPPRTDRQTATQRRSQEVVDLVARNMTRDTLRQVGQ